MEVDDGLGEERVEDDHDQEDPHLLQRLPLDAGCDEDGAEEEHGGGAQPQDQHDVEQQPGQRARQPPPPHTHQQHRVRHHLAKQ